MKGFIVFIVLLNCQHLVARDCIECPGQIPLPVFKLSRLVSNKDRCAIDKIDEKCNCYKEKKTLLSLEKSEIEAAKKRALNRIFELYRVQTLNLYSREIAAINVKGQFGKVDMSNNLSNCSLANIELSKLKEINPLCRNEKFNQKTIDEKINNFTSELKPKFKSLGEMRDEFRNQYETTTKSNKDDPKQKNKCLNNGDITASEVTLTDQEIKDFAKKIINVRDLYNNLDKDNDFVNEIKIVVKNNPILKLKLRTKEDWIDFVAKIKGASNDNQLRNIIENVGDDQKYKLIERENERCAQNLRMLSTLLCGDIEKMDIPNNFDLLEQYYVGAKDRGNYDRDVMFLCYNKEKSPIVGNLQQISEDLINELPGEGVTVEAHAEKAFRNITKINEKICREIIKDKDCKTKIGVEICGKQESIVSFYQNKCVGKVINDLCKDEDFLRMYNHKKMLVDAKIEDVNENRLEVKNGDWLRKQILGGASNAKVASNHPPAEGSLAHADYVAENDRKKKIEHAFSNPRKSEIYSEMTKGEATTISSGVAPISSSNSGLDANIKTIKSEVERNEKVIKQRHDEQMAKKISEVQDKINKERERISSLGEDKSNSSRLEQLERQLKELQSKKGIADNRIRSSTVVSTGPTVPTTRNNYNESNISTAPSVMPNSERKESIDRGSSDINKSATIDLAAKVKDGQVSSTSQLSNDNISSMMKDDKGLQIIEIPSELKSITWDELLKKNNIITVGNDLPFRIVVKDMNGKIVEAIAYPRKGMKPPYELYSDDPVAAKVILDKIDSSESYFVEEIRYRLKDLLAKFKNL